MILIHVFCTGLALEKASYVDSQAASLRAYRMVDPFVYMDRTAMKGWLPMVRCRKVFNKVVEDEYSDWFYDPVDTREYPDYLSVRIVFMMLC